MPLTSAGENQRHHGHDRDSFGLCRDHPATKRNPAIAAQTTPPMMLAMISRRNWAGSSSCRTGSPSTRSVLSTWVTPMKRSCPAQMISPVPSARNIPASWCVLMLICRLDSQAEFPIIVGTIRAVLWLNRTADDHLLRSAFPVLICANGSFIWPSESSRRSNVSS